MITVGDIIDRAARLIGIKAEDEALTGYQTQTALASFNAMVAGWRLSGIGGLEVGRRSAADPFPLGAEYEDATAHLLAERLAPEFGVPITFNPEPHRRAVEAASFVVPKAEVDPAILSRNRFGS